MIANSLVPFDAIAASTAPPKVGRSLSAWMFPSGEITLVLPLMNSVTYREEDLESNHMVPMPVNEASRAGPPSPTRKRMREC